jgi:TonB family protein
MRPVLSLAPLLAVLTVAAPGPPLAAQEEPLTAGSEGVPAPKRTKHVQPVYPQEALAQGIRGIVILEIVLDEKGKVQSTSIIRSVPGLDEAAIAAAQQWEYSPTKVDGKPVRVRVTVPVVFSLALPTLSRQTGIPELRQGVSPAWPAGTSGGGLARAEVTLEADGRVGAARILEGGPPWSEALLAALKTWRFAPPPEDEVLSFRVEAEFLSEGGGRGDKRVNLEATGLQRSGLLEGPPSPSSPAAAPPTAVAEAAPPAPAAAPPAQTRPAPADETKAPAQERPAAAEERPAPRPDTAPAPAAPTAQAPPSAPAEAGRPAPPAAAAPATPPAMAGATAPPPVEVITAPPPALPPESGVSAIRDVTLEAGVPDLTRGRRPVAPPLARMAGATGTVEVAFSVAIAGTTTVQSATGPDLLKPAAEQAVASWVFRRTRADRAYLVAVFTYTGDKSSVVVRPQAAPPAGPTAPPSVTAPPPGPAPQQP